MRRGADGPGSVASSSRVPPGSDHAIIDQAARNNYHDELIRLISRRTSDLLRRDEAGVNTSRSYFYRHMDYDSGLSSGTPTLRMTTRMCTILYYLVQNAI
jgi:hypothetical protein